MNEIETDRIDFQRKLNEERRKVLIAEEESTKIRQVFDKKTNDLLNEINEKDEQY